MPARVYASTGPMADPLHLDADADADLDVAAIERDLGDVCEAQAGSRAAFERLYCAYAPMVHGVLLAHGPGHDVDDLVQDVFITAWNRLTALRGASAFGGWLAKIARRRAIDARRSRRPVEP